MGRIRGIALESKNVNVKMEQVKGIWYSKLKYQSSN